MKYLVFVLCTFLSFSGYAQENEEGERENTALSCSGVERWAQKVLVDAAANSVNYTPITTTITGLATMPTPPTSTTAPRIVGLEDKTYKVTCNITIKKSESDNDYHLVLSDGTYTLVGEIPDPLCATAASSSHVNEYLLARQFIDANIASGNVNNVNIPPVVVTGVAFLDPPHGQTGKAPNNIELHPILDIHFASTSISTDIVSGFSISPNPFNNHINISFVEESTCKTLEIYNFQGRRVFYKVLNRKEETISLPNLPTGLYYYRVGSSGNVLGAGNIQHL